MSESANTDAVRRVYEAFRNRDLPTILELQAEDTQWAVAGSPELIPWAAPPPGREGVTQFLAVLGRWLAAERFEIRHYLAEGDHVVALGFQSGHVRPTGRPYAFDFVHVWTFRGPEITGFRVYYDTAYVGSVLREGSADAAG